MKTINKKDNGGGYGDDDVIGTDVAEMPRRFRKCDDRSSETDDDLRSACSFSPNGRKQSEPRKRSAAAPKFPWRRGIEQSLAALGGASSPA